MNYSRRDLAILMGVAAASAAAQNAPGDKDVLPTKVYPFKDIPASGPADHRGRKVMQGALHNGFTINNHITELGPGQQPHGPHHHVHEEIIMLHKGKVEVWIEGKTSVLDEPGSVWFIASGVEHTLKNVGPENCMYFVVEFRGDGK